MKIPNLVVMTGYPSAGKSQISKYLVEEHSFTGLLIDDLRRELFGRGYLEMLNDGENGDRENQETWRALEWRKICGLLAGHDVVVDSTSQDEYARKQLFNTGLVTQNTLIYPEVSREELARRNTERGRVNDANAMWDKIWEEPKPSKLYKLLQAPNETLEDQARIFRELDQRFGKRRSLFWGF
jgi:predicted kinase